MAQSSPVHARAILEYEENWEDSLTSLGPGPSHWLFTGGRAVRPCQDSTIEPQPDLFQPRKMSEHNDPATAEPLGQHRPTWTPTEDVALMSGRPGLLREQASYSTTSVDSLETCPSLRTSPSQLSLASWTSFDALDPDPFHADVGVLVATPNQDDLLEATLSPELVLGHPRMDMTMFKQLSRHHFATHQHPQLASRPFPKPPLVLTAPVQPVKPTSRPRTPKPELRPTVRPRHPLLSASPAHASVSTVGCTVTTPSSGVALTVTTVPRPHVATQPATLATSPAAWSMRSFLEAVGDPGSSAAIRSLRRMIRLDDAVDGTAQQTSPKPARKSRSALPHDWVMV